MLHAIWLDVATSDWMLRQDFFLLQCLDLTATCCNCLLFMLQSLWTCCIRVLDMLRVFHVNIFKIRYKYFWCCKHYFSMLRMFEFWCCRHVILGVVSRMGASTGGCGLSGADVPRCRSPWLGSAEPHRATPSHMPGGRASTPRGQAPTVGQASLPAARMLQMYCMGVCNDVAKRIMMCDVANV
jgi:hypothetical protein